MMGAQDKHTHRDPLFEPGVVISKKSHVVSIKKPFTNIKRYKASRPDELSIANIRLMLKEILAPRGKKSKHVKPPIDMKALFFKVLKYFMLLFILVFLGAMVVITVFSPKLFEFHTERNLTINYSYDIMNPEVISFRSNLRAYATLNITGSNVNYTEVDMRLYATKIPEDIMVLKSRRYKAKIYDDFEKEFEGMLVESGLSLNEIHVDQLMHMPSMPMILVVPSGRLPAAFLGVENPEFDLNKLLEGEVVVVYVGDNFASGMIPENGSAMVAPDQSVLARVNINFRKMERNRLGGDYRMMWPSYQIEGTGVIADGISVLGRGKGFLVTFPSTLDDGWINGTDAAHDIYLAVKDIIWLNPATKAEIFREEGKDGNLEIMTNIFSEPYVERQNLTAQFRIMFSGLDGSETTKIRYVGYPIVAKGTMNHISETLPTMVCVKKDEQGNPINCELYMTIDLNEEAQRLETMKIVAYSNGVRISETPIGQKQTQLKDEKLFYIVNLAHGDYVLKIEDDSGYVYAQSFLHVPKIEIKLAYITDWNWMNGDFWFYTLLDGKGMSKSLELKRVNVSLDGQQSKVLQSKDGNINYKFSGTIPEGDHQFRISFGEETEDIKTNFTRKREWWDNTIYQLMFVVAAIIGAVGFMIKKPDPVFLQLDVPDFPPLSKTKVPISKEQAAQIFNLVNADYRWRYMPLKHEEIKNGFRKLSYKGRPILVSDYNLERVLDQLMESGVVKQSMNFYGLGAWEKESGKTLDYLAIFRSLRDEFLNKSVHFTEFGQRTDCDIVATTHERYFVHIYEGPETINRVLATLNKGKTLLVFKDAEQLDTFSRSLYSSNKNFISVKMYVRNGNLFVGTPENVGGILK